SGVNNSLFDGRPVWMLGNFTDGNIQEEYDPTVDIEKGPLWNYGKNTTMYKCPADPTTVTVAGVTYPRVRSISMSQVFDFGQWLPSPSWGGKWRTYGKMSDIVTPVQTFVFIDENPKYL